MPRSRFSFPSGWDGNQFQQITEGWRALMDERARQAQEEITRAHEEAMQRLFEAQQQLYFRTLGANPPPHPPEPDPPTFLRKRTLRGKNGQPS